MRLTQLLVGACSLISSSHALIVRQQSTSHSPTPTESVPSETGTSTIFFSPTPVPLESILPTTTPTDDLFHPPRTVDGAKPSGLPNAPDLPDMTDFDSTIYSHALDLDFLANFSTPEAQEWIAAVRNSGVVVPDFEPSLIELHNSFEPSDQHVCANQTNIDTRAQYNSTDCWWSCQSHCTRKTDVVDCVSSELWAPTFSETVHSTGAFANSDINTILHWLVSENATTTFFVSGRLALGRPETIRNAYSLGNQIGLSGWSDTPLTRLPSEQVIAELGLLRKLVKNLIGVTPRYVMPPQNDIDDRVRAIIRAMGMTPVLFTTTTDTSYDSLDWQVANGVSRSTDINARWEGLVAKAGTGGKGVISRHGYRSWVETYLAFGYLLPEVQKRNFTIATIAQCAGVSLAEAYVETSSGTLSGSGVGGDMTSFGETAPPNATLGGAYQPDGAAALSFSMPLASVVVLALAAGFVL